jgi:hypothetical protein
VRLEETDNDNDKYHCLYLTANKLIGGQMDDSPDEEHCANGECFGDEAVDNVTSESASSASSFLIDDEYNDVVDDDAVDDDAVDDDVVDDDVVDDAAVDDAAVDDAAVDDDVVLARHAGDDDKWIERKRRVRGSDTKDVKRVKKLKNSKKAAKRRRTEDANDVEEVEMSRFYINYLAHNQFAVPSAFVLHAAKKNFPVTNGEHIGQLCILRSRELWKDLNHTHITILEGTDVKTGELVRGAFVCFELTGCDDARDTDDKNWLRAVPPEIMEHKLEQWKNTIEQKYTSDSAKMKKVFEKFVHVYEWTKDDSKGKLDASSLRVGQVRMVRMTRKLTTHKVGVVSQPRQSKTSTVEHAGANGKCKKRDNESDVSSNSTASTLVSATDLGCVGDVHVFQANGRWFMVRISEM